LVVILLRAYPEVLGTIGTQRALIYPESPAYPRHRDWLVEVLIDKLPEALDNGTTDWWHSPTLHP
jgi:hypothetical protein